MRVNPTRMELTRLKKALQVARKGHKLLKDKRDELMRQFLEIVREAKTLRETVEERLAEANRSFTVANSVMQSEVLTSALMMPKQDVELKIGKKNIMSVNVPKYEISYKTKNKDDIYSYGYAFTSGDLDDAISILYDVLPDQLRLAELEKSIQLIASEIEKTRRRVNALEHVMIPDYVDTIQYITMKLDENERSNLSRLMKVKDMMLEEKRQKDKA
ncbi:V-type ATP synthase subunit D [Christensenellaceae bacterium OttesenSCG-928-K19]|nr:V-type ATP synthase subunit D [Christensenellaceae bacterium OttesenSCG-928-K19]